MFDVQENKPEEKEEEVNVEAQVPTEPTVLPTEEAVNGLQAQRKLKASGVMFEVNDIVPADHPDFEELKLKGYIA